MIFLSYFLIALFSWCLGTLSAGGGAIIFMFIISFFTPIALIPILVSFVGVFAGICRIIIFKKDVCYSILKWILPGTLLGAVCGSFILIIIANSKDIKVLEILLAIFLFFTGLINIVKKLQRKRSKKYLEPDMEWLFLPFSFITSLISGIIGGVPPIINTLYRKFSLSPTQIVGTKSVNLITLQATKSICYLLFLTVFNLHIQLQFTKKIPNMKELIILAAISGLGAIFGILIGKKFLATLKNDTFNTIMDIMFIALGCYFFWICLMAWY